MISKINHVVIFVTDMDRAIEFYTNTLRCTLSHRSPDYTTVDLPGETSIGLHIAEEVVGAESGAQTTQVSFLVENIEQAYDTLRGKGVEILREIEEIAPGRFIFNFVDPDMNQLSCYEIRQS